jgi:hypothetical protein
MRMKRRVLHISTMAAAHAGAVRRHMQRLAPQATVLATATLGHAHRATHFDVHLKRNQNDIAPNARVRAVKRNKQGGDFFPGASYDADLANRVVAAAQAPNPASQAAIARHFGIAPSTVHKYLDRANANQPITNIAASREAGGLTRRKMDMQALL